MINLNQKTIIGALVAIIVILLIVTIGRQPASKQVVSEEALPPATTTNQTGITSQPVKPKTTTPPKTSGYISLAYSTAREAIFSLAVPVIEADFNDRNIHYCQLSLTEVRAVAPCADEVGYSGGFRLTYDQLTRILKILDISGFSKRKQDLSLGAFRPECTSCFVYIEFSGIHNTQGLVLPTKRILIRTQ